MAKPLTSVAIYLRGYKLDPALVSEVLGVEPTRKQKVGGLKHGSTEFEAKIGMWALSLSSDTRPVEEMIDDLIEKLGTPRSSLDMIEGVEDAHLDIMVACEDGPNDVIEIRLTKKQTTRLSQLGLSTVLTFYPT